jgi:hypothetical protein
MILLPARCCLSCSAATAANAAPSPQYGPYPPPSSPAVAPSPSPGGTVSAWDFILGVPELSRSAALLRDFGLDLVLREPFGGTLLLPVDAVSLADFMLASCLLGITTSSNRSGPQQCMRQHDLVLWCCH